VVAGPLGTGSRAKAAADGRRSDYIDKGGRIMVAMGGRGAIAGVLCEVRLRSRYEGNALLMS
jgi:hypothetical protein